MVLDVYEIGQKTIAKTLNSNYIILNETNVCEHTVYSPLLIKVLIGCRYGEWIKMNLCEIRGVSLRSHYKTCFPENS